MARSSVGAYWENQAKRELEMDGWYVVRSSISRGPFDLIAWNDIDIRFVQVKRASTTHAVHQARYIANKEMHGVPRAGGASFELWIRKNGEWLIEKL